MNPDPDRLTPYSDEVLAALSNGTVDVSVDRLNLSIKADKRSTTKRSGLADPELSFGDELAQYLADRGIYLTKENQFGG